MQAGVGGGMVGDNRGGGILRALRWAVRRSWLTDPKQAKLIVRETRRAVMA